MNVFRFLNRQIHNFFFHLASNGAILSGKGIIKNIHCANFGEGNIINIDSGASLSNCSFYFKGSNNTLHIRCGTHLSHASFHFEDNGNIINIGKGVKSERGLLLAACESCKIIIGDDCMFSNNTQVRTTDSHSILDGEGIRLNKAADIKIGNHVWVGFESLILKGCIIPDGTIVGARSVVTASSAPKANSIIAGTPAKIIKENINWIREKI